MTNDHPQGPPFSFPRWTELAGPALVVVALGGLLWVGVVVTFGFSPATLDVGHAPVQPVAFSHAVHAGKLGLDCRYCHNTVETAAAAAVPPTQTCMNCHASFQPESDKLAAVMESYASGMPIAWARVHDLPDYTYFDHGAHVTAGVGCVTCHGRVDTMEVVTQMAPLSMGWCLECHRSPEAHLRPAHLVTDMDWAPEEDLAVLGRRLREARNINPSTDCTSCHR